MRIKEIFVLKESEPTVFINGAPIKKRPEQDIIAVVDRSFSYNSNNVSQAIIYGIEQLLSRDVTSASEAFLEMLIDQSKVHGVDIPPDLWALVVDKVPALGA